MTALYRAAPPASTEWCSLGACCTHSACMHTHSINGRRTLYMKAACRADIFASCNNFLPAHLTLRPAAGYTADAPPPPPRCLFQKLRWPSVTIPVGDRRCPAPRRTASPPSRPCLFNQSGRPALLTACLVSPKRIGNLNYGQYFQ